MLSNKGKGTSFKKNIKSKLDNVIPGTKSLPHNFTLATSTGLAALDTILGGGLPLGSLVLLEEDEYSYYAQLLTKYFIAEGIVNNHKIVLDFQGGECKKFLSSLPGLADGEDIGKEVENNSDTEEMRIAWRYQKLKSVDGTIASAIQFGHNFDLTKRISEDVVKTAEIITLEDFDAGLSEKVAEILQEPRHSTVENKENLQVCRVAVLRLGPPFYKTDMVPKLLYRLRSYLRRSAAVAMVTVPSHLLSNPQDIDRWSHLADICIKLESFAGTLRAKNPALKDYHGLINIKKLAAFNSLALHSVMTDLAFKLRRRRLIIERLCLPPETEDTAARGEDDGAVLTCGSSKAKDLEF